MRSLSLVATFLIVAGSCASIRAQDLEPRAYSNSPTGLNFVLLGYGYTTGSVLTDPSLPIENVTNEAHIGVFGYVRVLNVFGKSGKVELLVPFAGLTAKGLVFGQPHTREISGLADPYFRFSINFIGAPALTAAEFKNYKQNLIVGASVRIVVEDNGHGMDAETLSKAFDPFFTTKGPGSGTGLGLSTVFSIVDGSGGIVSIDSDPAWGTRVTVQLPARESGPAERDLAASTG